jgi:hypothetical protein
MPRKILHPASLLNGASTRFARVSGPEHGIVPASPGTSELQNNQEKANKCHF